MNLHPTPKNQAGVSLAEVIVSIAIILTLFLAVFSLVQYVLNLAAENKFRMGAIMVADKKMEKIKNLPYDDVGTLAGLVHGPILDNEVITDNNGIFYVNTLIQYVDDPFDRTLSSSPADLLPADYKQATIRVRWFGKFGQKEIYVFTKIAPFGMETNPGGGILSIMVFNAAGQPVNQANVHIKNSLLDPAVDFEAVTDTSGRLDFPAAPASDEGYQITVSKANYSTSSSTARTAANPNPTQPNVSVLVGQKTDVSYAIDLLSRLTVRTVHQDLPENWQVNTNSAAVNQTNPNLAADGAGNLYFVWQDYRSGSVSKIYWQKYNAAGAVQWPSGDIQVSPANNQVLPDVKISTSSNFAYIGWNDNSSGNQDGYLSKRSTVDGSLQWGGPKKIDSGADSADQTNVRLALYNRGSEMITAVWQDNRDGNLDIFMQSYDNDKNLLWANEIKVNKDTGAANQSEPAITFDSRNDIYLVWTDERNGHQDIYAAKYNSAGQPLWANDLKINTVSDAAVRHTPALAIDGSDNLYIAWADEQSGSSDIYLAKFDSGGSAVWTPANLIVSALTDFNQKTPSLAVTADNNLYLSWIDDRNGDPDIYAQKLNSDGVRLWDDDVRVSINLGASDQTNPEIIVNPIDDKAYAAWQDDSDGDFDIFATQVDIHGAITNVANVPLTIHGGKQVGDNPIIYKFSNNYSTDAVGVLTLPNIEWDSYYISLPAGYSANHMVMTSPALPFSLTPNTDAEITIYLDN